MELVLLLIRIFLFGVFALAGIGKLLDLEGSEKAVKGFGVPDNLAKAVSVVLPIVELAIAVLLLSTATSWIGSIAALLLLAVFIGGMIFQIAKGNAPDCHCFGQIHSEPVGKSSLIRNIGFAILSLFLAAQGSDGQGASLADSDSGNMQTILILVVAVISVFIAFYLKKVFEQQTKILRRLEVLEVISREGVPVDRSDAGHPQDGLPIGSPFPDFELPDLSGKVTAFEHLLAHRRPMLFFFVSPTCEPCKAMMPEIEQWQAQLAEKVDIYLLSSGTAAENKDKFPAVFADSTFLQTKREVADRVRARWTPTALFIRADGTIGSHVSAGDTAIRELVEKIKTEDLANEHLYFANHVHGQNPPKIGEVVPEFALADINGNEITAEHFSGQKTLAVFWSLTCPHCTAMMSELKEWDDARSNGEPRLLVFSDGSKEDHSALELKSPILLDKEYETAEKLGMNGTPSAVLIDENRKITTEVGIGAANIWALIGRRNEKN